MLLFRSEGHVETWLAGRARGEIIPVLQLVDLVVKRLVGALIFYGFVVVLVTGIVAGFPASREH